MDKNHIMKKEDIKENVKEAQRVFVENLPKPKRWWQDASNIIALASAVIAGSALIVSLRSIRLSTEDFISTHRPYVYADSLIEEKTGIMEVNTVVYSCLNAPAKIDNIEIYYKIVKINKNGKEKTNTIPIPIKLGRLALYPNQRYTQSKISYNLEKEILDPNVKSIGRKIRIDYKELSSDRTYYFEGYWNYNKKNNVWDTNDMFGN